jgi:pimeloyl-ACP methyl ester carboxylesterase
MVSLGTPEAKLAAAACLYAKKTFESKTEVIERYNEVSMQFPASQEMMARQWAAVTQHDACRRLQNISSPTLTLTGSEDVLIPPENAKIMAESIPDARMRFIDDGGHLFLIEQPQQFNQAVIDFLDGLSN